MSSVNMREARKHLSSLVDAAERGEAIVITRRGRRVARLVPVADKVQGRLPDLSDFRSSIKINGNSLSESVMEMRSEERY